MQLTHQKTVLAASDTIQKVTGLCWAPNNSKLAAVTADRVVKFCDDMGHTRDKFNTTAADAAAQPAYVVRGMQFSPDSTKLAIAQSDNAVFVYRLGSDWSEKKSICNKFLTSSPVTCIAWPPERHNELVFGTADGKLRLGALKSNKALTLYAHPSGSYLVSLACSPDGRALVAGHADGSLYQYTFPQEDGDAGVQKLLASHGCVPYALCWGRSVAAAGNNAKVVFYDPVSGRVQQSFDHSGEAQPCDFASGTTSPGGDAMVFGSSHRLHAFTFSSQAVAWQAAGHEQIDHLFTVSQLAWRPDGSCLAAGSLTGAVDLWEACLQRRRHKGLFELTHVSSSAVIIKNLQTGARTVVRSQSGAEIDKVNIHEERFVVARTPRSLLLADLQSCRMSEVGWPQQGGEKFYFGNDKVALVYRAGELSIVEYGSSEVLATCRTEHASPYLLSVVLQEARGALPAARAAAYLVDAQTARVVDLGSGATLASISHDARIDWLELNLRGSHLLFRDRRRHLHAYNIGSQQRATLLTYCQYVQWVPASDVVVAQSRGSLCVWYNVAQPDKVTMTPIRGDVEGIERANNRTTVQVSEGATTVLYDLDEALIGFGAALEAADYEGAAALLEPLALTPETEAQWRQLADAALAAGQAQVAERCYAALGDVSKTSFLRKLKKSADQQGGGWGAPQVRAQLAMLASQWPAAEAMLLAQGKADEAIDMYKQLHRWEDAIRVADMERHPQADALRRAHLQWLLETGQDGRAGAAKQAEGDLLAAISLYLRGGLPAKAAQVVLSAPSSTGWDPALVDSICSALGQAGLHERCGEVLEALGRGQEALQAYRRGYGYRRAVELARREFPSLVVELEEEWGDWLMAGKQTDAAVNHFIEAGQSLKAVEAAIRARQFGKAAGIIDFLEPGKALPYLKRIAQHYEAAGSWADAERYLVKAGLALEAADMHARAGRWEAAQKVARGYLPEAQARAFFSRRARECEAQGRLKEAERAFVQAGEADAAISMYKKARQYEAMLRLVAEHRRESLPQAQLLVAQALAAEGSRREAERLYCEAGEWKAAVQMYRGQEAWEDALRVAKVYGGQGAAKQVAYAWVVTLGAEEGVQMLRRTGLLEQAVDYAAESGAFQHAFQLASAAGLKTALPDIHLRYAMALEDEGRFVEAEQEFVLAGKPREAIDMHLHCQDWDAASRVAEQHDPPSITDVLVAQAMAAAAQQQWQLAESVLLRARRPDLALKMYRDARLWQEALRIAEHYLPARVQEVQAELAASMRSGGAGALQPAAVGAGGVVEAVLNKARGLERGNDFARAIDAYLSVQPGDSSSLDALQQCWQQAAALALRHQRHRAAEVVAAVAGRLAAIGRHEAAAEAYESVDDVQGALKVYCAAGLFERARELAAGAPALQRYVDEQYTSHLVAARNADELAARGDAGSALELYCQQGEWGKVYELAARQSLEAVAHYAARQAMVKMKQRDQAGAAAVLSQRGVVADAAHFELYRRVALEVLALPQAQQDPEAEASCAQYLTRLVSVLDGASGSGAVRKQDCEDFRRLAAAARLASQASRSGAAGLLELAAKQRTALLRYLGIVPADKAFMDAGWAWKEARRPSMAFVLLNRYLDLIDAMEEPDSAAAMALLESGDFAGTDVPHDFPVPARHYAGEEAREEVRGYVLELSMDTQVEQTLSTVTCDACGQAVYEAALCCPSCSTRWEACAVSGYPATSGCRVSSRGGVVARREEWNAWVGQFQTCPVTGAPAQPIH